MKSLENNSDTSAKARTENENEKGDDVLPSPKTKIAIDFAIQVIGTLVVILGVVLAVVSAVTLKRKESYVLWLGFFTVVVALLGLTLLWQKHIWESAEAAAAQAASNDPQATSINNGAKQLSISERLNADELGGPHRPWVQLVGCAEVNEPLRFDASGPHINVTFNLHNGGSSAAIGVVIIAHLVTWKTWEDRPESDRDKPRECDLAALRELFDKEGNLIVPGRDIKLVKRIGAREDATVTREPTEVFLVGCVGYRDKFGNGHAMSFAEQYVSKSGNRTISPRKGKPVLGYFENVGTGDAY